MNAGGPQGPDPYATRPLPSVAPEPPHATVYGNGGAYLLARFAAFLIDVPVLAFAAASFAFGRLRLDAAAAVPAARSSFGLIALMAVLGAFVFAMLCEGVAGTTLGKALFVLHVYRARGGYAGLGRAIVRGVIRPVDLLVVGAVLAAVTPRHQRIGDFAAGTTVARSPIGPLAPVVSALVLGGLAYAEFAFGGGIDSAIDVAGETAIAAPAWASGTTRALATVFPALRPPGGTTEASPETASPETASPETTESPETNAATFPPEEAPSAAPATSAAPG